MSTKFFDTFSGQWVPGNFGASYLNRRPAATPKPDPVGDDWTRAAQSDEPPIKPIEFRPVSPELERAIDTLNRLTREKLAARKVGFVVNTRLPDGSIAGDYVMDNSPTPAAPKEGEWIEHHGRGVPDLPLDTHVQVRYRREPTESGNVRDWYFCWTHTGDELDITHYRIVNGGAHG